MVNSFRGRLTAVLTIIVSILALYSSLKGVLNQSIYEDLLPVGTITKFLIYGSIAQDIVSIPAAVLLAILSLLFLKNPGYKKLIAILGLTAYLCYGYGLYVMQGQYTSIYLVYLAIFGFSTYSLVAGLTSFRTIDDYRLPKALRITIGIFLSTILLVLVPVWLIRISPDIAKHIPSDIYGVFVLDLALVFPAFGIIVAQLIRNKPFGNVLAGVALIKTLTICLSVAFGEWYLALNSEFPADFGMITIFSSLTVFSLALIILYFLKLRGAPGEN